jgi:glycosidase
MNPHWSQDAIFYHIYPLGFCDAPVRNDFSSPPLPRLNKVYGWLDHLQSLGANAIYLGPVFESSSHGYNTANYFEVDRRLGSNETLRDLSAEIHRRGMHLILDGVFNHVGRDFWAFRDVLSAGQESAYSDWFAGLRFGESSPYHDPFSYEGWNGHYSLVKLNLHHPAVVEHLFAAVRMWIEEFNIDGLRLDAADAIDIGFLRQLAGFCRRLRPDFWLMGEVVHGDYRHWANAETLDSVTNYECYKGLYSSHVDRNYFEIGYSLNRQFGPDGLYRHLPLYNFADNHDVNRVMSSLKNPAHLYPLYSLLFTMPGIPSIYYGSEWGITGEKSNHSDLALRPCLELSEAPQSSPQSDLAWAITRLAHIRRWSAALKYGDYRQLFIDHEQIVFARQTAEETVIVAVNASGKRVSLNIDLDMPGTHAVDLLNKAEALLVKAGHLRIHLWPHWARILKLT